MATVQAESGTIVVAVPTIADNDTGEVAVDTSAAEYTCAVGDYVLVAPLAALPTDCTLTGAWVSDADEVTVGFSAQDGGVTGANVNFTFLWFDTT